MFEELEWAFLGGNCQQGSLEELFPQVCYINDNFGC